VHNTGINSVVRISLVVKNNDISVRIEARFNFEMFPFPFLPDTWIAEKMNKKEE
jgi:hypothetical protein